MSNDARRTRYNCTSSPPPKLSAVFRDLAKWARKRRGRFSSRSEWRGIISRVDTCYDRGPADELSRFLLNTAVLLEDPATGKFYYDGARAAVIQDCCERGCEPPARTELEERISQLCETLDKTPPTAFEAEDGSDEAGALPEEEAGETEPAPAPPQADVEEMAVVIPAPPAAAAPCLVAAASALPPPSPAEAGDEPKRPVAAPLKRADRFTPVRLQTEEDGKLEAYRRALVSEIETANANLQQVDKEIRRRRVAELGKKKERLRRELADKAKELEQLERELAEG